MPNTDKNIKQNTGRTAAAVSGYSAGTNTIPRDMDELVKSIASDSESLYRGIIYSEIFGRPKSKRRGRW